MSALTGDGPAIASGSHVCNGSWADLPKAPPSNKAAVRTAIDDPATHFSDACCISSLIFTVPKFRNRMKIPIIIAVSPTLVIIKAFLAAYPFAGSLYQNPISR